MTILFCESYEKLARFIFYFYDFDKDGLISKEDVRTVLSYVPLNVSKAKSLSKYDKEEFKDRVESQEELHHLLDKCFGKNEFLDINLFLNVIENVSSDIFLFILIFLLEKRPFSKKTFTEGINKIRANPLGAFQTPQIQMRKLIASPSMNSKFSPAVSISKSPSMNSRSLFQNKVGVSTEKQNLLNKLAGKPASSNNIVNSKASSFLNQFATAGKQVKGALNSLKNIEKKDEDAMQVDENVSVKPMPISRKIRNNLKGLEAVSSPNKMAIDSGNGSSTNINSSASNGVTPDINNGKKVDNKEMTEVDDLQVLSARKYIPNSNPEDNEKG